MIPRRYRVFAWIVPAVLLNCLLIAVSPLIAPSGNPVDFFAHEALSGTLFGQTTVAAAWTAFGPIRFMWRLPLSLFWVIMQAGAVAIGTRFKDGPPGEFIIVGLLLLCQWLLLQFPLWAVAIGFGVQLRHAGDSESDAHQDQRQFGIRQLMLVTAIVGVLFGIGRILVPRLAGESDFYQALVPILGFLIAAELVISLPLVLAALLKRHTFLGVVLALTVIGVATACELPLLNALTQGGGPSVQEVVALNLGTTAVMSILLTLVRLNGYSLARTQRSTA